MSEDIPQRFVVSHAAETPFRPHDFRPHLEMRDLGVAAATGGVVNIHVSRVTRACAEGDEGGLHYHKARFQYFYVLRGWQRMRFDGAGEITMRAGSGWLQPTGIVHEVLDYSGDFEVLCINLPKDFETVEVTG